MYQNKHTNESDNIQLNVTPFYCDKSQWCLFTPSWISSIQCCIIFYSNHATFL